MWKLNQDLFQWYLILVDMLTTKDGFGLFGEERQSLLANGSLQNEENKEKSQPKWRSYHTVIIMIVRIVIDVTFKNFLSFYMNYSDGLGVNVMQFAYIVIASEIGCMFAPFLSGFNTKCLKSDINIITLYLTTNGIACFLFILPSALNLSINVIFIIIWCSFCRFIIGFSYSFVYASSIHLSTKYISNPQHISSMIALLHYSWPLSTLLNIMAGYVIQYISWIYVWIICGFLLVSTAIFSKILFSYQPICAYGLTIENAEHHKSEMCEGLFMIMTDCKCVTMIFVSCLMTFRSRTIYIVTTSLWMERLFGLSPSETGWTTLAIVFGEVIGLLFVQLCAYRYKLWMSTLTCLMIQLFAGSVPLLILTYIYGNDIDGYLWIAILMIVLLAMGHESFYVLQQTNAVTYAPTPRYTRLLLLIERMSQEIGAIIGLWLTAKLWMEYEYDFIFLFACIWTVTTTFEFVILFIYKHKNDLIDV